MKQYFRIMLGKSSVYAAECHEGGFIGVDFDFGQDLTHQLPDVWRTFNKNFIPIYMQKNDVQSKISAGLACGMTWTVAKGLRIGDIVLSPNGEGAYYVGEITGGYQYHPGTILQHRRPVKWLNVMIDKSEMSIDLAHSAGSIGSVSDLKNYAEEIEKLISNQQVTIQVSGDDTVENPATFAMEKHLEDFLVQNWSHTALGKEFKIFEANGDKIGKQYPTDTGPIDILAISKDQKTLLVVELKRGRASDHVVGQILRYMGFVQDQLADEGQTVKGVIIALEDDNKLRQALKMVPIIDFYQYEVSFKLFKG